AIERGDLRLVHLVGGLVPILLREVLVEPRPAEAVAGARVDAVPEERQLTQRAALEIGVLDGPIVIERSRRRRGDGGGARGGGRAHALGGGGGGGGRRRGSARR